MRGEKVVKRRKRKRGQPDHIKLIVTHDGLKTIAIKSKPPEIQAEIDYLRNRFGLAQWETLIDKDE